MIFCSKDAMKSSPQPPPTAPFLPELQWPQVKGVVVRERSTDTSTQFRFQLVSNTAGVQVALQRSSAPLDRSCA
jgi:hypothetical protein